MNAELVVIADQLCRGEYVLGSCTHRPLIHTSYFTKYSNIGIGKNAPCSHIF